MDYVPWISIAVVMVSLGRHEGRMYRAPLNSMLRRRARACRLVAGAIKDESIRERLIVMAAEFEASASRQRRQAMRLGKWPHADGLKRTRDKLFRS